jgi:GNAT superfamily N-acetyltransferase
MKKDFTFHLLTPDKWKDIAELFGERGACGGCWCMTWRLSSKEFEVNKGDGNKKLFKGIVSEGKTPGIIAYHNDSPVGWCAFAPREDYTRLENSRVLKKIDDLPVLSVTCFFIRKDFRRTGLSIMLLEEVIKYANNKNFDFVEGYPVSPYSDKMPAPFAWTGLPSSFIKAGFKVAAERGKRKIFRYTIPKKV